MNDLILRTCLSASLLITFTMMFLNTILVKKLTSKKDVSFVINQDKFCYLTNGEVINFFDHKTNTYIKLSLIETDYDVIMDLLKTSKQWKEKHYVKDKILKYPYLKAR